MKTKLSEFKAGYFCLLWVPFTLTTVQTSEAELVTLPDMVIESVSNENNAQLSSSQNEFKRADLGAVNRADLNGVMRGLPSTGISQANGPSSVILRGASGGLGLVNLDGVKTVPSIYYQKREIITLTHNYLLTNEII